MLKSILKRPLQIILCCVVFLVAVVATAPASLIIPAGNALPDGIRFGSITGTIWSGVVHNVSVSGADAGDVTYKTNALSLLLGRLEARVSGDGADLYGNGVVSAGLDKKWRARDLNLNVNLAAIGKRYNFMGAPTKGLASLKLVDLAYAAKGCAGAEGEVWTDLLHGAVSAFSKEPFDLAGPILCEEGDIKIALTGANAEGEASVFLVIHPELRYTVTADVTPQRREVDQALRLMGFEEGPDGLVYDATGVFKGV
ncbi:MAG: type II secretion system protein N [Pseudomonadota bacterium]